jgi:ribonuclease H2 subunit A
MSDLDHIPKTPCTKSWTHLSPVPEACQGGEPCILGVDEAGRGPVLGCMVYAVAYTPFKEKLKDIGFADSKQLKPEERDSLFHTIVENQSWLGWAVCSLSPQDISESMLRRSKYNLNAMAHDTTISLIRSVLHQGVNLSHVYVDTVGPPEKYQDKLSKIFSGIEFTVCKKADSIYPIVSAASICAKVTRDETMQHWQCIEPIEIGREWGSGYPSDPNTVQWLKEHLEPVFGFPRMIRFSWSTCANLLEEHGVKMEWESEQEIIDPIWKKQDRDLLYSSMALRHVIEF